MPARMAAIPNRREIINRRALAEQLEAADRRDTARLVTERRQQGGAAPPQVRASARRLQQRLARARDWAANASDASDSVARGIVAEASAIATQT